MENSSINQQFHRDYNDILIDCLHVCQLTSVASLEERFVTLGDIVTWRLKYKVKSTSNVFQLSWEYNVRRDQLTQRVLGRGCGGSQQAVLLLG